MKFPSIKNLADNAIGTFKRFPFETLFALAGTVAATIYINGDELLAYSFYTKILMTANLGLLLSLAATLFTESKGAKKQWLLRLAAAIAGGCTIFIHHRQLRGIDGIRFFLISFALHLLVAFVAFTGKGHIRGFWQFNKTLFLRFLASVLYSAVLYLGLAAALEASNLLFNLHIDGKVYGILFAWISGVFNTTFFLAGVPENTAELDDDDSYPKGLKVFTQYVLIPLASVYVIILLAYEVKILIQWHLPKGLVSNLILGYAVFGILSLLLIHPLRNLDGNKWIKTYARSFYFLMLPLLILLFLAVFSRILPYGVTPQRYFLIVLACWLTFITFYFLLSRGQNIKIIPISLGIVSLLSVYGPQSAFSVSDASQRSKLTDIFKKYGAFKNGKLTPLNKIKVDSADKQEVYEKQQYFVYENDITGLQPCISVDINKVIDSIAKAKRLKIKAPHSRTDWETEYQLRAGEADWLTQYLGTENFNNNNYVDYTTYYSFGAVNKGLIATRGNDYVLALNNNIIGEDSTQSFNIDNIRIKQNANIKEVYSIELNGEKLMFDVQEIAANLVKIKSTLKADTSDTYNITYTLPNERLSFTKQTAHFKVTFQLDNLTFNNSKNGKDIFITQVQGTYLISVLR